MVISTKTVFNRLNDDAQKYINECEQEYSRKITEIADVLCESKDFKPIILLSGPSGAGKTTTSLRLENILDKRGFETHTVSMDDYFKTVTEEEIKSFSLDDYESPKRLDDVLLKEHLKAFAECLSVKIPEFDFKSKSRVEGKYKLLERKPDEFIIIEGIHALNPGITGNCSNFANIVYVSTRARLETSLGEILHPSAIRLLRRILRDKFFRGKSVASTISGFESVERGAQNYILPYKYRADFEIDTVIPYELGVYKKYILSDLYEFSNLPVCSAIIKVLEEIKDVDERLIPDNSLMREFIGGSSLEY